MTDTEGLSIVHDAFHTVYTAATSKKERRAAIALLTIAQLGAAFGEQAKELDHDGGTKIIQGLGDELEHWRTRADRLEQTANRLVAENARLAERLEELELGRQEAKANG